MCTRTKTTTIYTCGHRKEDNNTIDCTERNSDACKAQKANVKTMGSTRSREKCDSCKLLRSFCISVVDVCGRQMTVVTSIRSAESE